MKKILQERDKQKYAVNRKRARRKKLYKQKLLFKRKKLPWPQRQPSVWIQVPHALRIMGPKNRRTVLKFFKKLREEALERRAKITLNFIETKTIEAPAMLLFVAELDRINRILQDDFSISIANAVDINTRNVLIQVGVYSLCGHRAPKLKEEDFKENVKHWRYATGVRVDESTSEAFENIEGRLSPALKKGMWKGVSEALINSVQHAYAAPRNLRGVRLRSARWWMFSELKGGLLTVAVCDLGIGIPRSLPLNWNDNVINRLMATFSRDGPDVRAVKAAMQVGATSTSGEHRGKGLPQIWNAVRTEKNASIMILSNAARLVWNGDTEEEFAMEYSDSIAGTLVMWTVKTPETFDES